MVTRIPSSQGLVWRSAWEVPCEGPFSLAAKVACANELQFADVRDWVFARNQTTALLGNGTIRPILCSSRVRYCRTCMTSGYHPSLFQFWHIENCPIHDQPLRINCASCLAPTTLFPFDRQIKTSVDLRCPRCTEPYGLGRSGLSLAGWGVIDGTEKITEAYAGLKWINDAVPFTTRLLNRDQWGPTSSVARKDEEEEVQRGKALFWVLERVYGPGQGDRILPVGLFHERSEGSSGSPSISGISPETGDLAVRLNAGMTLDDFGDAVVRPNFGAPIPVLSKVPAWVHAVSLWRLQHTEQPSPSDVAGSRCQADWLAASRIAVEWHNALVRLEALKDHPVGAAALLSTDERWCMRLGRWANRGYSPVLHIADDTQMISAVI